jgi:ankyrin repeat protein
MQNAEFGKPESQLMSESLDGSSGLSTFRNAVHRGDAAGLRAILADSADVRSAINDPLFSFDSPALVAVAGRGDVPLVDVLLEYGADPNRRSSWWAGGFHPLHASKGAVTDRLLAAGAIPDACAASRLGRVDLLEQIIRQDPSRVHERGGDGQTPLHFAASRAVIDVLLNAGADPNARDVDHRATPAEWMLGRKEKPDSRTELARYLVERGATADIFMVAALGLTDRLQGMLEQDPHLLSLRTGQGDYGEKPPSSFHMYLWNLGPNLSPLQVAAQFGQDETLRMMERFASPVERLLAACHLGHAEVARSIARANPGFLDSLDAAQQRALTDEAWAGNAPAVELLLELGFDPAVASASGPRGGTALHCAAWQGSVACVEAVLRYPSGRALINTREPNWNGTPLSWCCHGSRNCGDPQADHAAVARVLLAAGALVTPDLAGWDCADAMQAVVDEAIRTR